MKSPLQGQILDHLTRNARFYLLLYFTIIGFQQDIHHYMNVVCDPTRENVIQLEAQHVASIYDWKQDEINVVSPSVIYLGRVLDTKEPLRPSSGIAMADGLVFVSRLPKGIAPCRSPPDKLLGF